MIKIARIKYPPKNDVLENAKYTFPIITCSLQDLKYTIINSLFECNIKADHLLININNQLYVIEPLNAVDKTYSKKKVKYHPHKNLVIDNVSLN
jgi:hypothetical protein